MRKTCLDCVYTLAQKNENVLFIGSDLGPGVLDEMKHEMPDRFYMEGVSEQHLIGMAAGLAMEGFVPYVNTIATFLTRRCYEQLAIDLCLHDLPVRLIANGGGAVYAPLGPTHLAVEDISILRALPNMTIVSPCDAEEMKRLMEQTINWPHPIYIRLAKGGDKVVSLPDKKFEIGKAIEMVPPGDGIFISSGVMTQKALEASNILRKEGIDCGVLHVHTIKPLDVEAILRNVQSVKGIVTVEENTRIGGLGSAILEMFNDEMPEFATKVIRIGIPDSFATKYGSQDSLLEHWQVSVEQLVASMRKLVT